LGGPSTMTVCTNHVASGDLVQHGLPVAVAQALGDVEALVPNVVELQDERVALAAVEAWLLAEEGDELSGALDNELSFPANRLRDVPVTMRRVVLAFVLRPTGPAVVVALAKRFAPPSVVRQGLALAAASADPGRVRST
jgi:hypothetical protein